MRLLHAAITVPLSSSPTVRFVFLAISRHRRYKSVQMKVVYACSILHNVCCLPLPGNHKTKQKQKFRSDDKFFLLHLCDKLCIDFVGYLSI